MSRAPARKGSAGFSEGEPDARIPHPRETLTLEGHDEAAAIFTEAHARGKLHHAWLITGEQGIGKATFAYAAARALISGLWPRPGDPQRLAIPPEHPVARQIAAGAHPSLFVLERDARPAKATSTIAVDDVRRLSGFLQLTGSTARRVAIVDMVDDLTAASANALLKAIEEPPEGAVFFLIGRSPGGVMPTIRSRCAKLHLRPLSNEPLRRAVLAAIGTGGLPPPEPGVLAEACARAAGSPGRALAALTSGRLALAAQVDALIRDMPRLDGVRLHALIGATVTGGDETFETVCDLIEEALERALLEAVDNADSAGMSGQSLARMAELWEKLRTRRRETVSLNLDKAAFLFQTFTDLASQVVSADSATPSR